MAMWITNLFFTVIVFYLNVSFALNASTSDFWSSYKIKFKKNYLSDWEEEMAKNNYTLNLEAITMHNENYGKGLVSYQLAPNQFTDMPYKSVEDLFRDNQNLDEEKNAWINNKNFIDSFSYSNKKHKTNIYNQGVKCNSGWAYATATALEIFLARTFPEKGRKTVSAQHFIDCLGGLNACRDQTPSVVIDYLYQPDNNIYHAHTYKNTPNIGQGYCDPPRLLHNQMQKLTFNNLPDDDHESMTRILKTKSPIILEFSTNSFEFIHYSEGIFVPPSHSTSALHYMVIVGYGTNSSEDYWLLQNSFGQHWGEKGYMRLARKYEKGTRTAIYPEQVFSCQKFTSFSCHKIYN